MYLCAAVRVFLSFLFFLFFWFVPTRRHLIHLIIFFLLLLLPTVQTYSVLWLFRFFCYAVLVSLLIHTERESTVDMNGIALDHDRSSSRIVGFPVTDD